MGSISILINSYLHGFAFTKYLKFHIVQFSEASVMKRSLYWQWNAFKVSTVAFSIQFLK